jgi:import inner membrane translocase subunit TIM44
MYVYEIMEETLTCPFVLSSASIFSQSETSEALTEICRVDPAFDVAQFLRVVQYDIIPNIFEVRENLSQNLFLLIFFQSLARGELDILKDWCTEAVSVLHPC